MVRRRKGWCGGAMDGEEVQWMDGEEIYGWRVTDSIRLLNFPRPFCKWIFMFRFWIVSE
jgi:hypothetical protein